MMNEISSKESTMPGVTVVRIVTLAMGIVFLAGNAVLAGKYKEISNALWRTNQIYSDHQVSADRRTLTTHLPAPTSISTNFQGRVAGVDVSYGPGDEYHPAAGCDVSPRSAKITCHYSRSNGSITPEADTTWLRTLQRDTTVTLRVKGFGTTTSNLTWVFQPASGDVYISKIEGSSSASVGGPYEFTLRLTAPAPSGGLNVMWRINPANCFTGLPGNSAYNATGAINNVTIPEGNQYLAITLGVREQCTSNAATIQTWTHERVDRAPYYVTRRIGLVTARR